MPSSLSHRDIQRKRREINTRGWTGGRDRGRASFLVAIVAAAAVDSSFLSSSKRTISRWKLQVLFYSIASTVSIAPTERTLTAVCVESCMRAEKRERCLLDRRTKKKKTLNFLTSLCFGVVKGKKKEATESPVSPVLQRERCSSGPLSLPTSWRSTPSIWTTTPRP